MITILNDIDVTELLDFYNQIEQTILWTEYGHKGRQTSLQFKEGEDPWISGLGKRESDELAYFNLNPFYKNTPFEKIINEYGLLRTRLMWMYPYACYSMHQDYTPRLHIPLVTNLDCYFIFKPATIVHLEIGKIYRAETRIPHTFINCSDSPRLHLIGILKK